MQLISTTTVVGAAGASYLEFLNIPQTFDDLMLVLSVRSSNSTNGYVTGSQTIGCYPNGSSYPYSSSSFKMMYGGGWSPTSINSSGYVQLGFTPNANATTFTFSNVSVYIPNYSKTVAKTYSIDSASENNSTSNQANGITSTLDTNTAPITSLKIDTSGGFFVEGSSASLYGITAADRSLLWDFLSGTEGFTTNASTISASGGILTWTPTAGDPFLISPTVSVSGLSARYIKIKWKRSVVAQSSSWAGQIFYSTPGHSYSESYTKFITQPTWTSDYQTTVIDMGTLNAGGTDYTSNIITSLRLDFTNGSDGASYLIDSIELSSKP